MLKIRLSRFGRKNVPHFRVVVAEHSRPVKGQYLEKIGFYNPKTKDLSLDKDKALDWIKKGAKPSNTVAKLLKKQGLKHPAIVIKVFKAKSKVELESEKVKEEEERRKKEAEREAQKAAWEQKSEEIAKEQAEEKAKEEEIKVEAEKPASPPPESESGKKADESSSQDDGRSAS